LVGKLISCAVVELRKFILTFVLAIVIGLSGVVALSYVLWQSQKPVSATELEQQIIEFLKTTDVKNVWNGVLEIKESYEHKTGGTVAIVQYTTTSGGHPHFMLEFIEGHTAVITLGEGREVTSAFCVHGSLRDGLVWDLINQRWISGNQ